MSGDLTIKSLMTELTGIKTEVKTRRAELSKMLEREKEISDEKSKLNILFTGGNDFENKILDYLKNKFGI